LESAKGCLSRSVVAEEVILSAEYTFGLCDGYLEAEPIPSSLVMVHARVVDPMIG
jgi:hypothetical protein